MTALAEAPAITCGRAACEARGTLCRSCTASNGGLSPPQPASVEHVALDGWMVWLTLRVKLSAACDDGISFDSSWRYVTGEIIETVPPEQARGWRRTLDGMRVELEDAYLKRQWRRRSRCSSEATPA